MKYPCIESTVDMEVGGFTVRLWINETDVPNYIYEDYLNTIPRLYQPGMNCGAFAEEISKRVPKLNAVQVKRSNHGVVLYLVDFSSDVHG